MVCRVAFTLSETLIALVIIGIIAAITIPGVVRQTKENEWRSAMKKANSALNRAIALEYSLNGKTLLDFSNATDLTQNLFKKRMAVLDVSVPLVTVGDDTVTTICTGSRNNIFTTNDGMIYCVWAYINPTEDGKSSGAIFVDVNGQKKPNKRTDNNKHPYDVFWFAITSDRQVYPAYFSQAVMYK